MVTQTNMVPIRPLDVEQYLPRPVQPKPLHPPFPPGVDDSIGQRLWRMLWTDPASSGERSRQPSEPELRHFPELVHLVREAMRLDGEATTAANSGRHADGLRLTLEAFKAYDAAHTLVTRVVYNRQMVTQLLGTWRRTYPQKTRQMGEDYAAYKKRFDDTVRIYAEAGVRLLWAEDRI